MSATQVYLKDLHHDHKMWSNELRFVRDEIGIFEERLGELVTRNTDKEMLAQVEHFQNQFIRHRELVDTISHDIKIKGEELVQYVKDHPVAIDHVKLDDHVELREAVETYMKRYTDLKAEFQRFSSKWM